MSLTGAILGLSLAMLPSSIPDRHNFPPSQLRQLLQEQNSDYYVIYHFHPQGDEGPQCDIIIHERGDMKVYCERPHPS